MEDVYHFLDKKNLMEEENFEKFFESSQFNALDENQKREIFYMKSFYMSTKEYDTLKNCINDFIYFITNINDNDYLHNTHECYEIIINN